ncbi:hypothetical protein ACHAWC_005593 [Mediolabrus comicus]
MWRGTMTMHQLLLCTLLLIAVTIQISEAFVVNHPVVGGTLGHIKAKSSQARFHAASSSENENNEQSGGGGTEWIKNAMGTTNANDDTPSSNTPPPPSAPYTEDEIKTMENLILELSLEKDDTIRRAKLSAIFDKVFELDVDTTTTSSSTATADGGDAVSSSDGSASSIEEEREAPRFAQLFQYSLDNVGELVQSAAREKAELLNSSNDSNDGDNGSSSRTEEADAKQQEESSTSTTEGRVKSEEELQLWALIDMMVQSKTMVKMYMGSLGSKGVFR